MIVPLVVVLAIADDVHIMQHWDEERRHGRRRVRVQGNRRPPGAPLLGASVTTALGMLSLATSDVVAVRTFGIGSAVGIMVDFAISLVLMPTMLSLVRAETAEAPHERYLLPPLRRVARALHAAAAAGVPGFGRGGAGRGAAGSSASRWTRTTSTSSGGTTARVSLRRSSISELAGVYSFQIMLEGPPGVAASMPDALAAHRSARRHLSAVSAVRKVTSVADYVKRINRELNDGRVEAERHPSRRRHDRAGALRVRAGRRGPARARADRRERLLARPDQRETAVDQLGRRAAGGRAGRRAWP